MRIAMPLALGRGGLPHYAAGLANALADDHEVHVLKPATTSADDAFDDAVEVVDAFDDVGVSIPDIYKLNVNPVSTLRSMYSFSNLRRLHDVDPDVVHDPMGLFVHLKFFLYRHHVADDYPFVVTYHELRRERYPLSHPPMALSHLLKDLVPNVPLDAGVVHTAGQADVLRASSYRPAIVERIPHGAYDFFTDYDYDDRPEEPNTVLFFGNVIREKGVDVLVDAIPKVAERIPDVTLVVAGDGVLPERSRAVVERHPELFETTDGYVANDEVGSYFSRAAAVVAPYRALDGSRGHSGVLSTAFSFGTPVVATDVGDFSELVADSGAGVVVPPEDVDALADAIVSVLSDDGARATMAERSAEMGERLSWDNVASEYVDVYERAIENHHRRRGTRGERDVAVQR